MRGDGMESKDNATEARESTVGTAYGQDLATILSRLPRSGIEDDVARLMDIYEVAERSYRASVQANSPTVRSSASTSL